jgi:hypothetical protein
MMLLGASVSEEKQVAVLSRNQRFTRIFCSILEGWKFTTVADLTTAKIIFAERGLAVPNHAGEVVWLSPMPLPQGAYLTTPISLTSLYRLLEKSFFPGPRRNIRIAVDLAAEIRIDETWHAGRMVSLSDRGARIDCKQELPRGKQLHLELALAGRVISLSAEVLYCLPAGDSPGRELPQVGILFKPNDQQLINRLRHYVEKTCIETACVREGIACNDPSISWFDLPSEFRNNSKLIFS